MLFLYPKYINSIKKTHLRVYVKSKQKHSEGGDIPRPPLKGDGDGRWGKEGKGWESRELYGKRGKKSGGEERSCHGPEQVLEELTPTLPTHFKNQFGLWKHVWWGFSSFLCRPRSGNFHWQTWWGGGWPDYLPLGQIFHRCKKRYLRFFLFRARFLTFLAFFLFFQRFLFLKTFIENTIWDHLPYRLPVHLYF